MKVENGSRVEMHYRLFDAQGELVESTEGDDPVRYEHGSEEILPGLEKGLEGASAGKTVRVEVDPEDGYGIYNPEGLVSVPRSELPAEHDYEPGAWLSVSVEADPENHDHDHDHDSEMEMRIVEVRETEIVLDANHPLAGQRVTFEVDVLKVEPA